MAEPEPVEVATSIDGERGAASWRRWLAGGSPREVLARIVQGDPLRMRERVARRLREEAWLLAADRVHLRSLARCARSAPRYRGRPELSSWLDGIVGQAIADLLREDREGACSDESTAFADLARPLGLDVRAMRSACSAFNRLEAAERRAFFRIVLDGRSLDEQARASGESATEIARRARRALDAVLAHAAEHPRSTDREPS